MVDLLRAKNAIRSVMTMDADSSDAVRVLFEIYEYAYQKKLLKPFRLYTGEYLLEVEDVYKGGEGEFEYLTFCPNAMCIRYHKGDDYDKYTLNIPRANNTCNKSFPDIGKFVRWTDLRGKEFQGRVHRVIGDWIYIHVWDGNGLDTKSWFNNGADLSDVYDLALTVDTCELYDGFLDQLKKVQPYYVFIIGNNLLMHEIEDFSYRDIEEETYIISNKTARETWAECYLNKYSIGYDELSYVGYVYSFFKYEPITDSFREWDHSCYPTYMEKMGKTIIESEPHICSQKYLQESFVERIRKKIPDIKVDRVMRKNQADEYDLITTLLA